MFPRAVALLGLAFVAPPLLGGCSASGGSSSPPPPSAQFAAYDSDASEAGAAAETPVGLPAATLFLGNPLCQSSWETGCYPDDLVNATCALAVDGGASDGGTDGQAPMGTACHVVSSGEDTRTACLAAGYDMNSTCTQPTDCAAGHECVGDGTCRHYCCSGNSACSTNQFCDVQPVTQSPKTLVPVCMPQIPCTLLDDDSCPASQQCGVVREDGATSCVDLGTAGDREPCDDEHCARGFVCLGAMGSRRCAPLCYTAVPSPCNGSGRTCTGTLPLFPDPTIGACQ